MGHLFFQIIILFIIISFALIQIAKKLKLYDKPNGRRKHKKSALFIGGIIINFCFMYFVKMENSDHLIELIYIYALLMCLIGLIDDIIVLNYISKLTLLCLPIFFLIFEGLTIDNLGNFLLLGKLNLGKLNILITLLFALFIINAFNYSDGIDGNCSLLTINSFLLLVIFSNFNPIIIPNFLIVSIITFMFLILNFSFLNISKVFLGNNGSLSLGFLICFFSIYLNKYQNVNFYEIIWAFNLVVFDCIAVSLLRISTKKNIFNGDNNHIHHILNKKFGLLKSLLLINLINLGIGLFGYNIAKIGGEVSIIFYCLIFVTYLISYQKMVKKKIIF